MHTLKLSLGRTGGAIRMGWPKWLGVWASLAVMASAHAQCKFHGEVVEEGKSVQAFKDAFVPDGKACETQARTCRGGKLSGGFFQPECKPVKFVKPADPRPFRRSDVMFTLRLPKQYYSQPWYDLYQKFQANRIVWTYAGDELLQDERVVGKIPVQCALEYWVPANHPERDQMSCQKKDAAGKLLGFAEHPVYKLRVPDTNTKAWRDYAYGKAKDLVFLGCSSFAQDVPAIMAVTRNTRSFIGDGCHSEESESRYKDFKQSHPGASYPDFMKASVAEYHEWLHKNLRKAAKDFDPGYEIYFSANTSAVTPAHLQEDGWFFPYFDFLQGEVFGDFSHNDPAKTVTELVRYLKAKESGAHPVVLTMRSDSTRADNVAYLRRATMSTYSLGMVPMIPWTASALTDNPLIYFYGDPKDFADIYAMVRAWPTLFDAFDPGNGEQLIFPGKKFNALESLKSSSDDLMVSARNHVGSDTFKNVYIVNWGREAARGWVDLKKSDFPRRPNAMLRVGDTKPVPIEGQDNGAYYRYEFSSLPEWAVLFRNEKQ